MSSLRANASRRRWLAGDVGEDPQLDLAVVRRDQPRALLGDEGGADLAPGSVRIGIACRFRFVVERRPVEAAAWLKVVCRRPSRSEISCGSGPRYVLTS